METAPNGRQLFPITGSLLRFATYREKRNVVAGIIHHADPRAQVKAIHSALARHLYGVRDGNVRRAFLFPRMPETVSTQPKSIRHPRAVGAICLKTVSGLPAAA